MPIMIRLKELFDEAKVSYEVYNHPLAYTAQEIAARQHFLRQRDGHGSYDRGRRSPDCGRYPGESKDQLKYG